MSTANVEISKLMAREDHVFLNRELMRMDSRARHSVKSQYKREFIAGMDETEVSYKKTNKGRRRANLYLLSLNGRNLR